MDTISPPLNIAINFLAELFNTGISYSALCVARSALSCYITTGTNITFGNLPEVKRLMKGAFETRPVFPHKSKIITWDPHQVLSFLETLSPNKLITLKELSMKLVMLIALCTGQRCQTLHKLNLKDMYLQKSMCTFTITSALKHTRKGHHLKPIQLKSFPHKEDICVINVLHEYIDRTKSLRAKHSDQLFISYQKPYKPVSKDTIARWLKNILDLSGIDTSLYSAHTTRAASCSAVQKIGLPINSILEVAGWSRENTFSKYYKKQTLDNFGQSLMTSFIKK